MAVGRDAAQSPRQLQRRNLRLTLADADGNRVAGVIPLVEVLHLPLRRGHHSGHLVGQVDAGLRAQAECGCVFGDGVDTEFLRQCVEKRVAGERNGLADIQHAMVMIAVEEAPVECAAADAIHAHILGHALLQAGRGHDDFEGRSRSKLVLNGLVHQRMVGIGDELVPVGAVDAHGKGVGVVAGMGNQGENLAVAGVHGHHGAVGVAQRQFRGALQVNVDGQLQVLAGDGVLGAQVAHLAPMTVHHHVARAVLATQQLVIGLLNAGLAHHVARFVGRIARVVQILLAHLAHVADQVGRKAVARIKPALHVDRLQLGQFVAMRLDEGLLVGCDLLLDGNRLVDRAGAIAAQRGAQQLQVQVQPARNQRQVIVHIAALLADQVAGDRRVVVDDQPVFAIKELAARGHHRLLADAVLLGLEAVIVHLQHL